MQPNHISRRRFVQAAGLTGATALAGCVVGNQHPPTGNTGQTTTPVEDVLPAAKAVDVDRIAADPTDVPAPVDWTEPRTHDLTLRTEEHVAEIEPGVTFSYMTYNGQVPGPMLRVRVGDTVNLTFEVPEDHNVAAHNVDSHAIYGPGGGAEATTLAPGDGPARIRFKASYPGLFIYHCAVPNMDQHISSGMFGAILVEPEEGLPAVDRELYLGQHELYTKGSVGEEGHHEFDFAAMREEDPTYVVFNGEAYGFTADGRGPMEAAVDETVRVYFVNGGPNLTSAWHPIGNVWSRLYRDGDVLSEPARYVETTPVAPGTATMAEMELPVPGHVKVVDHALSRAGRRGALADIDVRGDAKPEVYDPDPADE
ncbi:nitrite reductase, copper-containing [Natronomonas salina]|uniref:copper-containing nitrite reductase n=1 Tax=Natronomonas salina TaxID=1710540 RepID=UPI0015B439A9|nr:copper-containing nitrite reductase [Natronomonas salina]QLD90865.1 nitrite reductase, copper-containing [Natronomonas salina]